MMKGMEVPWEKLSFQHKYSPSLRHSCASAIIGDCLYIFGGFNCRRSNEMWKFHITERYWSRVWYKNDDKVVPLPRSSHSMVAIGTSLYIFGGECDPKPLDQEHDQILEGHFRSVRRHNCLSDLMRFDTIEEKWHFCPQLSIRPRRSHTSTYVRSEKRGDEIWVYGGQGPERHGSAIDVCLDDVFVIRISEYGIAAEEAELTGVTLPKTARHASVAIGKTIFYIGGIAGEHPKSQFSVYSLDTETFVVAGITLQGHELGLSSGHRATVLQPNPSQAPQIYIFGGHGNNDIHSHVHAIDSKTMFCKRLSNGGKVPHERADFVMEGLGTSMLFIFGGTNKSQCCESDVYLLSNPSTKLHLHRKNLMTRLAIARNIPKLVDMSAITQDYETFRAHSYKQPQYFRQISSRSFRPQGRFYRFTGENHRVIPTGGDDA